jgi:hypothetical protein
MLLVMTKDPFDETTTMLYNRLLRRPPTHVRSEEPAVTRNLLIMRRHLSPGHRFNCRMARDEWAESAEESFVQLLYNNSELNDVYQ